LVDVKEKGSVMATQRMLAIALAVMTSATPLLAQQANGIISGTADDEAKKPYSNYSVQLRDVSTGQIVSSVALDALGQFSFENVGLSRQMLVELVNVKSRNTVCTEGPFALTPTAVSKTNVKIDCGRVPSSVWILAAGAGTAAAIGLADGGNSGTTGATVSQQNVQSPSQ
jgi:hypothetical protein